jgi:hypothetical protein
MEWTVRNEAATGGWVAEMIEAGFRVLSRPVNFGETRYIVKLGEDHVAFVQAPSRGRKFSISVSTAGQQKIIAALIAVRVLV